MKTKNKVLFLLEENVNSYISGQHIADQVGISRMAVWKAIRSLKDEGYLIDSITNKGYRLLLKNDILSEEGIRKNLREEYKNNPILVMESTGSTNSDAKKMGIDGALHGTVVVTNEQTQGRGRFGRTFSSSKGKGIYMSIIIRPAMNIQEVAFSTILSVVAVSRAIRQYTSDSLEVKWVNDIYANGKKICGILTELVSDIESGGIDFIVVGVGLNVNASASDFPEDIRNIAGSLQISEVNRNKIISEISMEIMDLFKNFEAEQIIQEYREQQLLLGKSIRYERNGEIIEGIAKDIDPYGGLIVDVKGNDVVLRSGEVSVKMSDDDNVK